MEADFSLDIVEPLYPSQIKKMDKLREDLKEQTSKELHKNKKMAYAKRKK